MAPLQKLPNNVGNLGKIIVATSFELLPKVQKSPILVTLVVGLSLCTNPPSLPPYIFPIIFCGQSQEEFLPHPSRVHLTDIY